MVIDFHTHSFPEKIAQKAVERMSVCSGLEYEPARTADELAREMVKNGIDLSVNLPVMTSCEQVEKVNSAMIADMERLSALGILTFGGMHPDYPAYKTELRRLREAGIKGIKIHPAFQGTDLDDIRYLRILNAASQEGLIVVTHAGLDIGLDERNYATPQMILRVLKSVQPEKLVLAHMGCWGSWETDFEQMAGAPVMLDTAFSLGEIPYRNGIRKPGMPARNLTPEAFTRFVRMHGANKVLFATDSPWGNGRTYREFVNQSGLTEEEKEMILHLNAARLLGL